MQVQILLWERGLKTTPSALPELVPGAADQHAKPTPWKPHLFSRAGDVAQQGTRTAGDGAGSVHQRFLPLPVVATEIADRDRLGLIYQQRIFDLEQKYWSEGGTQPYLKNRLGWLTARPAPGDAERGDGCLPAPEKVVQPSGSGHHQPHGGEALTEELWGQAAAKPQGRK